MGIEVLSFAVHILSGLYDVTGIYKLPWAGPGAVISVKMNFALSVGEARGKAKEFALEKFNVLILLITTQFLGKKCELNPTDHSKKEELDKAIREHTAAHEAHTAKLVAEFERAEFDPTIRNVSYCTFWLEYGKTILTHLLGYTFECRNSMEHGFKTYLVALCFKGYHSLFKNWTMRFNAVNYINKIQDIFPGAAGDRLIRVVDKVEVEARQLKDKEMPISECDLFRKRVSIFDNAAYDKAMSMGIMVIVYTMIEGAQFRSLCELADFAWFLAAVDEIAISENPLLCHYGNAVLLVFREWVFKNKLVSHMSRLLDLALSTCSYMNVPDYVDRVDGEDIGDYFNRSGFTPEFRRDFITTCSGLWFVLRECAVDAGDLKIWQTANDMHGKFRLSFSSDKMYVVDAWLRDCSKITEVERVLNVVDLAQYFKKIPFEWETLNWFEKIYIHVQYMTNLEDKERILEFISFEPITTCKIFFDMVFYATKVPVNIKSSNILPSENLMVQLQEVDNSTIRRAIRRAIESPLVPQSHSAEQAEPSTKKAKRN